MSELRRNIVQLHFALSDEATKKRVGNKIYDRGEKLLGNNTTFHFVLREQTLVSDVQEPNFPAYRVEIFFEDDGSIQKTRCQCKSPWRECEHIAATLLMCSRNPGIIDVRPPVAELLKLANQETLHDIVSAWIERHPEFSEWLDDELAQRLPNQKESVPTPAPVAVAAKASVPVETNEVVETTTASETKEAVEPVSLPQTIKVVEAAPEPKAEPAKPAPAKTKEKPKRSQEKPKRSPRVKIIEKAPVSLDELAMPTNEAPKKEAKKTPKKEAKQETPEPTKKRKVGRPRKEREAPAPKKPRPPKKRKKINLKNARKIARDIFIPFEEAKRAEKAECIEEIFEDFRDMLAQVKVILDAQDPTRALKILEYFISEWAEHWDTLSKFNTAVPEFWTTFESTLVETLLTIDFEEGEQETWSEMLTTWQKAAEGADVRVFHGAMFVIEEGWEDERLQDAMAGDFEDAGFVWGGRRPAYADLVTRARFAVLGRLGEEDAALNLALAEQMLLDYFLMLVQFERFDMIMEEAPYCIEDAQAALRAAKALHQRGQLTLAQQVAELGIKRGGAGIEDLQKWTEGCAEVLQPEQTSAEEALFLFERNPSLAAYEIIRDKTSAKKWPKLKEKLFKRLNREMDRGKAHAQIYLCEGMIDEAIRVANDNVKTPEVVRVVFEGTKETKAPWAIAAAKRQAEEIIDEIRAEEYDDAITWLKDAYDVAKQNKQAHHEFYTYVNSLIAKHRRKHKLLPMLREVIS